MLIACEGPKTPTGPGAPNDPSKIISDGAHCSNVGIVCNRDFFFLPPMVPLPLNNPNFELGQFNNTLRSAIRVDICELQAVNLVNGLPSGDTPCNGNPIKTFPAGSVNLVNLPLRQNGWWSSFGLPADGFYYVLWDTRQSNLNVNKYYRIKVFIDGATEPLGVADVDPMANIFQWKYTLTGQVIQLVDDVMLPIPFRIEHGGGAPVCGTSNLCVSTTVTNNSTTGTQSVTLEGGAGSIAGARFPNGWLPVGPGLPQSVVVTIAQITTAGGGSATDPSACHTGLALPQYRGCFSFTTYPHLNPINSNGDQFAQPVTVAVCYELDGGGSALEKFAELWASGPGEAPHPLDDAPDAGLLGAGSRNCNTTPPVIGSNSSNPLVQFASASWQKVKHGFSQVFGVKTAYGVDLGLGGIATAFSRISPVLTARMVTYSPAVVTNVAPGATLTDTVRIVGNNHHATHTLATGLAGIPVTFTLASTGNNGSLLPVGGEGLGSNLVSTTTNLLPLDATPLSGGGFAIVRWTLPLTGGTYTLTATSAALASPVTFTTTVVERLPNLTVQPNNVLNAQFALNRNIVPTIGSVLTSIWNVADPGPVPVAASTAGLYFSNDATITTADNHVRDFSVAAMASLDILTVGGTVFDAPLAPGNYFLGLLADNAGVIGESNETDNFASVPFTVRPVIDFSTLPAGAGVCDGAASCSVTGEYANAGVVFAFVPDSPTGGTTASLCQTIHGPVGAPANYGVTPAANGNCSGWDNGTVAMNFAGNPTTVWFDVTGNNAVEGDFAVTAFAPNQSQVPIVTLFSTTWTDQFGNTMRREVRRVENAAGIATILVNSSVNILSIDNLLVIQ
jgi:hypothetical protein